MKPQDETLATQRAIDRALLEGRARCCHGQGQAAYESILECRCGKAWHTGCITKFLVNRDYPEERCLLANDGTLYKIPLSDPFACCKASLSKYATERASSQQISSDIETASGRRHRLRIAKLKAQGYRLW